MSKFTPKFVINVSLDVINNLLVNLLVCFCNKPFVVIGKSGYDVETKIIII